MIRDDERDAAMAFIELVRDEVGDDTASMMYLELRASRVHDELVARRAGQPRPTAWSDQPARALAADTTPLRVRVDVTRPSDTVVRVVVTSVDEPARWAVVELRWATDAVTVVVPLAGHGTEPAFGVLQLVSPARPEHRAVAVTSEWPNDVELDVAASLRDCDPHTADTWRTRLDEVPATVRAAVAAVLPRE